MQEFGENVRCTGVVPEKRKSLANVVINGASYQLRGKKGFDFHSTSAAERDYFGEKLFKSSVNEDRCEEILSLGDSYYAVSSLGLSSNDSGRTTEASRRLFSSINTTEISVTSVENELENVSKASKSAYDYPKLYRNKLS